VNRSKKLTLAVAAALAATFGAAGASAVTKGSLNGCDVRVLKPTGTNLSSTTYDPNAVITAVATVKCDPAVVAQASAQVRLVVNGLYVYVVNNPPAALVPVDNAEYQKSVYRHCTEQGSGLPASTYTTDIILTVQKLNGSTTSQEFSATVSWSVCGAFTENPY
jgi:hypothetical protein